MGCGTVTDRPQRRTEDRAGAGGGSCGLLAIENARIYSERYSIVDFAIEISNNQIQLARYGGMMPKCQETPIIEGYQHLFRPGPYIRLSHPVHYIGPTQPVSYIGPPQPVHCLHSGCTDSPIAQFFSKDYYINEPIPLPSCYSCSNSSYDFLPKTWQPGQSSN